MSVADICPTPKELRDPWYCVNAYQASPATSLHQNQAVLGPDMRVWLPGQMGFWERKSRLRSWWLRRKFSFD